MPNITLEDIDNWVDKAEAPVAITSLAASGGSLLFPAIAPFAVGTNLASAGIDLYQGIRSGIKGDWNSVVQNAIELGLSLLGAKYLKQANKLYKLDKALDASGASRTMITKNIGRGRGRRTISIPKELNNANNALMFGVGSTMLPDLMDIGSINNTHQAYNPNRIVEQQDNTRNINRRPTFMLVDTNPPIDEESITKQRKYVNNQ